MADSKITALTALTAADPVNDMFPVVDVSDTSMAASGTTKKISVNNILGASGTATLASATITGDLTAARLIVTGGTIPTNGLWLATTNTLEFAANSLAQYRIAPLGVFNWYDGAGGTRMTLNSTGLGIGGAPSYKFQVYGSSPELVVYDSGANGTRLYAKATNTAIFIGGTYSSSAVPINFTLNGGTNTVMTLDASGNLLVGTTNSSFGSAVGLRTGDSAGRLELGSANSTDANIGFDMYSTGAAAYRFYVGYGGTVYATNTTISAISDARLKENVQDLDVGLGAILALKPRKFDWKEGKGKNIKGDRGFIAQEFEQVFPQLVDEWKDPAPEGEAPYKSVRQDLIPVLVKAIQELTARVQTLEAR
jgi:hypothetical protein